MKAIKMKRLKAAGWKTGTVETGDPSISLDLIVRAFLATGATRRELGRVFA